MSTYAPCLRYDFLPATQARQSKLRRDKQEATLRDSTLRSQEMLSAVRFADAARAEGAGPGAVVAPLDPDGIVGGDVLALVPSLEGAMGSMVSSELTNPGMRFKTLRFY